MMGRCRTHHHAPKKRCEDLLRKPITAVDHLFLKPKSTANSQTIPDESVTRIAVKEDKHQNISADGGRRDVFLFQFRHSVKRLV